MHCQWQDIITQMKTFADISKNTKGFDQEPVNKALADAEMLLKQLRIMKVEACMVEAFRHLKQAESIKKILRRETLDMAASKLEDADLHPQIVTRYKELLEPGTEPKGAGKASKGPLLR